MIQLSEKTKRKKAINRAFRKLRAKQAKISGRKPERDKEYLAWIRTQWCVLSGEAQSMSILNPHNRSVCEEMYRTEAAHVGPTRGIGQKCSDYDTIPLCSGHHRLRADSHHRLQKAFWKHHNLDREAIIKALNAKWEQIQKGAGS